MWGGKLLSLFYFCLCNRPTTKRMAPGGTAPKYAWILRWKCGMFECGNKPVVNRVTLVVQLVVKWQAPPLNKAHLLLLFWDIYLWDLLYDYTAVLVLLALSLAINGGTKSCKCLIFFRGWRSDRRDRANAHKLVFMASPLPYLAWRLHHAQQKSVKAHESFMHAHFYFTRFRCHSDHASRMLFVCHTHDNTIWVYHRKENCRKSIKHFANRLSLDSLPGKKNQLKSLWFDLAELEYRNSISYVSALIYASWVLQEADICVKSVCAAWWGWVRTTSRLRPYTSSLRPHTLVDWFLIDRFIETISRVVLFSFHVAA